MEETMTKREFDPRRTIVLSDGKSLGENTLRMFAQASIDVSRTHLRDDVAALRGCPGFSMAVFGRADQVAWLVAQGYMAAGITGHDQVIEGCADVHTVVALPFNRATTGSELSCVIFTREDNKMATLRGMRMFKRTSVVTEYPREVAAYLQQHDIWADVIPCTGKAEMLVRIGIAEYGATITETGTSIRVNGLKIVRTPEVFRSTTLLVANKEMYAEPEVREYIDFLGRLLKGVLEARGKLLLAVNAPRDRADAISQYLVMRGATLSGPGIKDIHGRPELCAIDSVVPIDDLNEIQIELTRLGATGFIPLVPKTII
ncbi:ATP phosphoribosyltransferase [Candidatus Kaiserbacteria bacterium RIFCSPHIGHO2_02_FULL_54_11b]|uniref:ATP phosphoribosyltransferase n=2 Tax=Candidatus Kaiseribacteriota TaxID=1752734 RepID=A0A1F6CMM6_9BACT|nr:MAG: ATP phosphoribosyltransferase [Candidatus Kaiserbacteria bacterium RIFCSPHIGHO2_01_FULL_54_36b]OGG63961.1 MAG: ATP phosphoribosyltransferase [Candidatus Kaiserbacteria bacterium RIFCSPHIGHO2_02_FULL_54_11b]